MNVLKLFVGSKITSEFYRDDDVKTELGKRLREELDNLLEKLRETVEQGKGVKEDLVQKVRK